jgi:hypothetical protein
MDRGIWAIWYELPDERAARAEYFEWFHGVHIPDKLARPGYLWAAHYELGHGGPRFQKVVDGLVHASNAGLGRGRGFLALFGGLSAHTFLNPSPGQLKDRQDALTRRMIGLRQESYTCIFAEETRVNGPDVAKRGPGITPGPFVQMGNFNAASHAIEDDIGAWYAQHRLPFMASMPGCIGARKLLATAGWGKHSILYEYASLEAREERFIPHEEQAHDGKSWTARILPQLVHAPCSPAVGKRIWPDIQK